LRNSFNRGHFPTYIHVYTVFAPYSPSYTLSPLPSSSRWYWQPPTPCRICSSLLFSNFVKEWKNQLYFCLFKIATYGISLWHVHVYMYYSPIWFISSIFLLSTSVPFSWLFQSV
jgi:hypothetical protein